MTKPNRATEQQSLFATPLRPPPQAPKSLRLPTGRTIRTTVAFDSYWILAAERQAMLARRLRGDRLLTLDRILATYRFTNSYRAADRVSQFLIREILPYHDGSLEDLIFRVLLFKIFNKAETWHALQEQLGEPIHLASFSAQRYGDALSAIAATDARLYSNAYIMPSPPYGHPKKHRNHLELLQMLFTSTFPSDIASARSLKQCYETLRAVPSFGPFLAFQYAIDLNYSDAFKFDEMEFVVAGPGAIEGIQRCFEDNAGYEETDLIRFMADMAPKQFDRLGLTFLDLWGRSLHLIDCQNLFCEVGKYSRVAHSELIPPSGRSRIKQRYVPARAPLPKLAFPSRWQLDISRPLGNPPILQVDDSI